MGATTRVVKQYWNDGSVSCVLCLTSDGLEVRLYERRALVAMWPCEDCLEACELARQWRERRPRWPPFRTDGWPQLRRE